MDKNVVTQTVVPEGVIDLGMGNPDLNLLPLEMLHQSAEKHFASGDRRSLQYGAEQGDGHFRVALANFLAKAYGENVDPKSLFVTTGVSAALDLICTLFTQPGDMIFAEEPTYFLALRVFEDHGLNVVPIPMDDDGLQIDVLEEKLAVHNPKFIYTIPTFQNPSGLTLTQARREKLAHLAQQHDFLIVADEVYHLLPYSQTPPQAFALFSDVNPQVISLNSFSKILAPGLRLGWIQAHASIIEKLSGSGLLDSGGGLNPFMSSLVRGLVETGGLEENVYNLRAAYAHRLNVLDNALREYLPQAEYTLPQGGFFFWVRFPGMDTTDLRQKAQAHQSDIRQGSLFSSEGGLSEYARLCFSYYGEDELVEGVKRLGKVLI